MVKQFLKCLNRRAIIQRAKFRLAVEPRLQQCVRLSVLGIAHTLTVYSLLLGVLCAACVKTEHLGTETEEP